MIPQTFPIMGQAARFFQPTGLMATDDPTFDPSLGHMDLAGGGGASVKHDHKGNPIRMTENHQVIPVDMSVRYRAGEYLGLFPKWQETPIKAALFPKDIDLAKNMVSEDLVGELNGAKVALGSTFDTVWTVDDIDPDELTLMFSERLFADPNVDIGSYKAIRSPVVDFIGDSFAMAGAYLTIGCILLVSSITGAAIAAVKAGLPLAAVFGLVSYAITQDPNLAIQWAAGGVGVGAALGGIVSPLVILAKMYE